MHMSNRGARYPLIEIGIDVIDVGCGESLQPAIAEPGQNICLEQLGIALARPGRHHAAGE